jgi:hypothetical protein
MRQINVNKYDNYMMTPLIWACKNNMEIIAYKLLERPEIIISNATTYGKTAICYAVENRMGRIILKMTEITERELFDYK